MKKILAFIILSLMVFTSCNKKKSTEEVNTESKLLGKWLLKTSVYMGQTIPYPQGDYLEFESGGKLTAKINGSISYSTWDLLDANKTLFIVDNGVLDVPSNGYEITTLSNVSLILYALEPGDPSQLSTTINLEK